MSTPFVVFNGLNGFHVVMAVTFVVGTAIFIGSVFVSHTIKKGDTLIGIAKRQLGAEKRLADLQALNPGLDPTNLRIGQKIRLPRK